ncbi:hypothetical protein RugamoR64_21940 [Duganella rhizosphaerae]|uniref:lysozyme inhibitor LprI family protein n=1 Tax=Duganella rhizosphaerae TaxID=2885763 RepID=UPI0030E8279A
MRRILIAALGALLPACALAQGHDPCDTPRGTPEVNLCALQKFEKKDLQLNAAYQTVLKQLASYDNGAAMKKLLVVSQRKWVEFRDADCAARQSLYQGGTGGAESYHDCMTKHTEQRIKELQPDSWQAG